MDSTHFFTTIFDGDAKNVPLTRSFRKSRQVPLVNHFMSITVSKDNVHYKVYAASSEELLFEDIILL